MKSSVYEVKNGNATLLAEYTINSKEAMISFIKENNSNTLDCSVILKDMRKSPIKKGWLYDDIKNDRILVSYEE